MKGRIDPSWVGSVGQGRGRGCVLTPKAPKRAGSVRHGRHGTQGNAEKAPHRVPVLSIRGACDEDAGPHVGLDTMKAPAKSCSTKARELIVSRPLAWMRWPWLYCAYIHALHARRGHARSRAPPWMLGSVGRRIPWNPP